MSASRGTDATRVLRGAQMVLDEIIKAGEYNCKKNMKNCSVTAAIKDGTVQFADKIGAAKLKVMQCIENEIFISKWYKQLAFNNIVLTSSLQLTILN